MSRLPGIGLFSLRFLIQPLGPPAPRIPGSKGLFISSLVMIGFTAFGIAAQIWFRRRIVTEFSYHRSALRFSTLGTRETQTRHISEVAEIADWHGRGGLQGYRIRYRDKQKVYLQFGVANSVAAAEQMRRDSRRTPHG